jgi:Lectin C-type domain
VAGKADTRDPRPRASARLPYALFVCVFLAVLLAGIAVACLPDLAPLPDLPDTAPAFVGCGDQLIATLDDGGDAGESCDPGKPNDIDAQAQGCQACQITCEGKLDPATGHCYFAAGGGDLTYSDARTRCKNANAHVVTFASSAEVAFVENGVANAGAGYWVGLSRNSTLNRNYASDVREPGFAYPPQGPCTGCFGSGANDAGVFPFDDGDPSSECLVSRGGSWFQVGCNKTRATICEREPVGIRDQGGCIGAICFTLPSTAGTKTYLVTISGADPDVAAQTCASLDGGSLVIFESAEEREQLANEIFVRDPTAPEQTLWIGLAQDGGAWVWDDGVPAVPGGSRPLPWGDRQPELTAPGPRAFMRLAAAGTAYDTQLAYADDGGRAPRLYVCQRPPQ